MSTATPGLPRPRLDAPSTLWLAALALFGVGDLATTAVGLQLGAVELAPSGQAALARYGLVGLASVKVALCGALWLATRPLSAVARVVVPTTLAVCGALLTAWNGLVILALV